MKAPYPRKLMSSICIYGRRSRMCLVICRGFLELSCLFTASQPERCISKTKHSTRVFLLRYSLEALSSITPRSCQVEAVQIHHLVPRGDEIVHKHLLRIGACVHLRDGSEIGV